jgi:hypothetical protein
MAASYKMNSDSSIAMGPSFFFEESMRPSVLKEYSLDSKEGMPLRLKKRAESI